MKRRNEEHGILSLPPRKNVHCHILSDGRLDFKLCGAQGLRVELDVMSDKGGLFMDRHVTWQELFASNSEIQKRPDLMLAFVRDVRYFCAFKDRFILISRVKHLGMENDILCLNLHEQEQHLRLWDAVAYKDHGLVAVPSETTGTNSYKIGNDGHLTLQCDKDNGLRLCLYQANTEPPVRLRVVAKRLQHLNTSLQQNPMRLASFVQSVKYVALSRRELFIICRVKHFADQVLWLRCDLPAKK